MIQLTWMIVAFIFSYSLFFHIAPVSILGSKTSLVARCTCLHTPNRVWDAVVSAYAKLTVTPGLLITLPLYSTVPYLCLLSTAHNTEIYWTAYLFIDVLLLSPREYQLQEGRGLVQVAICSFLYHGAAYKNKPRTLLEVSSAWGSEPAPY